MQCLNYRHFKKTGQSLDNPRIVDNREHILLRHNIITANHNHSSGNHRGRFRLRDIYLNVKNEIWIIGQVELCSFVHQIKRFFIQNTVSPFLFWISQQIACLKVRNRWRYHWTSAWIDSIRSGAFVLNETMQV